MSLGVLFEEPFWLLLLLAVPPLLWLGWRQSRVRLSRRRLVAGRVLRALALLLLVLALAGLTAWRHEDRLTVLFALDASRSVGLEARAEAAAFLERAAAHLPDGDLAGVIVFGTEAMVDSMPAPGWKAGDVLTRCDPNGTDLEGVVRLARGLFPPGHEARLVLLTDGVETAGSIEDSLLGDSDAPDLAWYPLPSSEENEVLVERVAAPERLVEGEPHRVRVVLRASQPTEAMLRVFRGPTPVAASKVRLEPGRPNVFTFEQEAPPGSGLLLYRARVETSDDGTLENNRASALVRVEGKPRVLLLDEEPQSLDPMKASLTAAGMEVEASGPGGFPGSALDLAAWDAVVMADVAATSLAESHMVELRTWVEAAGGGLLMQGGPDSFGPGGYWHTPVEEILPVDTEVKDRTYFPSLGLVLCIDKSGSMSGMAREAKIEVAKAAAAEVAKLMMPRDRIGLVAFDEAAKWVIPMMSGGEIDDFIAKLGHLRAGGGTDPYPALVEAHEALNGTDARVKHVLMLTDGQVPSRDYATLLRRMVGDKITVSTVGVGTDADLHTLERMAHDGDGRFYVARDIDLLPRIFIREAFHVARSWISEEPFVPVVREDHPALAGLDLSPAPQLLGYVGTSEKPSARHPLATPQGDPLLSLWRTGLGKSVAFTSDAKGRWGANWLQWDGYAPFWSRLTRWARREESPDRLRVTTSPGRGTLKVAADLMDQRGGFLNGAEVRGVVAAPDGTRREVRLRQTGPGRYETEVPATQPGPYLAAVFQKEADGVGVGSTSAAVVPYSDEFRSLGRSAEGLERLVQAGRARIAYEPDALFEHLTGGGRVRKALAPWLLAAAACLLLLEVAVRKMEMPAWLAARGRQIAAAPEDRLAALRSARKRAAKRWEPAEAAESAPIAPPEPAPPPSARERPTPPASAPPEPAALNDEDSELASRLLAAKKRRRR